MQFSRHDDFKKIFEIQTQTGLNTYTLPFHPSDLANLSLRLSDDMQTYELSYLTEEAALYEYPDLNQIPQGKPVAWFISTSTDINAPRIGFILAPDGQYIIRGMQQVTNSTMAANSNTPCNEAGDRCIKHYLEWILQVDGGFADAAIYEAKFREALNDYMGNNSHKNIYRNFFMPYQHQ